MVKYSKYNLTKGINEKYRLISEQVIENLPDVDDWLDEKFIKQNNLINWNECIKNSALKMRKILILGATEIVFDELRKFFNFIKK